MGGPQAADCAARAIHLVYPMSLRLLSLLPVLICLCACVSIPERSEAEAEFRQACRDVSCDAAVMNLAAHPDDESARTLVYLRRKFGVRTITVYSTCGEGGQNAIGKELGPDLARIRTRETLAAARITGTEVRWLEFADFGFSKTAEESFERWGGRELFLERLGREVAAARPDLILTNHRPKRGHGHHRATVLAAVQLLQQRARQGLITPLYARSVQDSEEFELRLPVWDQDDVTGLTYGRQALKGWRMHRTQGVFGPVSASRVTPDRWGRLWPEGGDGAPLERNFRSIFDFADLQPLLRRDGLDAARLRRDLLAFAGERPRQVHLREARRLLPVLQGLARGLDEGGELSQRLGRRVEALERLLMLGHKVSLTASMDHARLAEGGKAALTVTLAVEPEAGPPVPVSEARVILAGQTRELRNRSATLAIGPLEDVDPSRYPPAWIRATVAFRLDGLPIRRQVAVRYTPVERVSLRWDRSARLVPVRGGPRQLEAQLSVAVQVADVPAGEIALASEGDARARLLAGGTLEAGSRRAVRQVRIALPDQPLGRDTSVTARFAGAQAGLVLRPVDARVPERLRVGLVRGPDESLQRAMEDLGIAIDLLDEERLAGADWTAFDTLILDIRAYRHRPDLAKQRQRILSWCAGGGRVLCFYHKPMEWNEAFKGPLLAPFALEIGRDRVCEEDVPVTLLQPEHRLWRHPNRISPADFVGWVQERGLNFPRKWAEAWQPMLRMNDRGEAPLDSALLYARHGQGQYIYCSLALYRQLKVAHPGAARILVNLLTPER